MNSLLYCKSENVSGKMDTYLLTISLKLEAIINIKHSKRNTKRWNSKALSSHIRQCKERKNSQLCTPSYSLKTFSRFLLYLKRSGSDVVQPCFEIKFIDGSSLATGHPLSFTNFNASQKCAKVVHLNSGHQSLENDCVSLLSSWSIGWVLLL